MICTCPICENYAARNPGETTLFRFAVGWSLPRDEIYAKPPNDLPRQFDCPFVSRVCNCAAAKEWCENHFAINIKGSDENTPWMRTDPNIVVPAPPPQPKLGIKGATSPNPADRLPPPTPLPPRRKGPHGQYGIHINIADCSPVKRKKHLTAEQWRSRMNKMDEKNIRAKAGTLWQDDQIIQDKIATAKQKRADAAEQRVADIKARST